jgi:hypothetical protein
MKQLWQVLRYSSVGTFAAGILMVIQACSPEREGVGLLVLLLALNMCTGNLEDQPEIGPASVAAYFLIDNFNVPMTNVASPDGCGFSGQTLKNASLPFGSREVIGGAGDGALSVRSYFNRLSANLSGADCEVAFMLMYPNSSTEGAPIDLSAYTKFQVLADVTNLTTPNAPDIRMILKCEGGGSGAFQINNVQNTNGFKMLSDDSISYTAPCADLTSVVGIEVQLRNLTDGDTVQIRKIRLAGKKSKARS